MKAFFLNIGLFFFTFIFIKPCLAQLSPVYFSTFEIDPAKCQEIVYQSGTRIYFPSACFINSKGSRCSGTTFIQYREIHNPIDILASSLSMSTIHENKTKLLESAGIFEIHAICGNDTLSIAPGKKILVRFASYTKTPDLSLYYYDKNKRNWIKSLQKVTQSPVASNKTFNSTEKLWGSATVPVTITKNPNTIDSLVFQENEWDSGGEDGWGWEEGSESRKNNALLFNTFEVSKTGICNLDRLLEYGESVPLAVDFTIKNSTQKPNVVFIIYSGINTLVETQVYDWKELRLLPRDDIKLFSLDKTGNIYLYSKTVLNTESIRNMKGKNIIFELDMVSNKPVTKDEMANLMGIKISNE